MNHMKRLQNMNECYSTKIYPHEVGPAPQPTRKNLEKLAAPMQIIM
jgi:hypothetical protein